MSIKISVCVITYNHERYLRTCLDSILAQEIDSEFDVIVRDDGSIDSTAAIVQEYVARFPQKVRALPTLANIGANANLLATFAASDAPFIAVCEGDDFWTDTRKLARQLDSAMQHPQINFFVHPAVAGGDDWNEARRWPCQDHPQFTLAHILDSFGQFAPTASYFFRRSALTAMPTWFSRAPIGDFFMELYLTGHGAGFNDGEMMAKYRTVSVGSWDDSIRNDVTGEKGVRAYRLIKVFLKKARKDFPDFESSFLKRLAMLNVAIAHQYMKVGNYAGFRKYMNKAGVAAAGINAETALLFGIRNVKLLVLVVYNLRKIKSHAKAALKLRR